MNRCCKRSKFNCEQGRKCPNRPEAEPYSGYTLIALAAGVAFVIFVILFAKN